jgi:hypothetical protein
MEAPQVQETQTQLLLEVREVMEQTGRVVVPLAVERERSAVEAAEETAHRAPSQPQAVQEEWIRLLMQLTELPAVAEEEVLPLDLAQLEVVLVVREEPTAVVAEEPDILAPIYGLVEPEDRVLLLSPMLQVRSHPLLVLRFLRPHLHLSAPRRLEV